MPQPMTLYRLAFAHIAAGLLLVPGTGCRDVARPVIPEPDAAAPDDAGSDGPLPSGACLPPVAQSRILLQDRYADIIARDLGVTPILPGVGGVYPYQARSLAQGPPELFLENALLVAEAILAAQSIPGGPLPCAIEAAPPTAGCLNEVIAAVGSRVFRRALSAEEIASYAGYYRAEADKGDRPGAARLLLASLVASPQAIFPTLSGATEDGPQDVPFPLTGRERATNLGYFLFGEEPNEGLLEQADSLSDLQQVASVVISSANEDGLRSFFQHTYETSWLALRQRPKDPMALPGFDADALWSVAEEATWLFKLAAWTEQGSFEMLMTTTKAVVSSEFVGLYPGSSTEPVRNKTVQSTTLPNHPGLLTRPAVMARLATSTSTSPAKRGRFVLEEILCRPVPVPSPDHPPLTPPPPSGATTMRERTAPRRTNPSCAGCHRSLDAIGLAFENYDAAGRFRQREAEKVIDASGVVTGVPSLEGTSFADASELVNLIARAPEAQRCFVQKMYEYAQGRAATDEDACHIDRLMNRFRQTGGKIDDLAVAVATDESFLYRRRPGRP